MALGPLRLNWVGGNEMARVSVDDELHADHRFKRLVRKLGDEDKAIGLLYRFWRIAQDYWGDEMALIPTDIFEAEDFQILHEVGLAEKEVGGFYASGSEEKFNWYLQRCRASKAGVEARRRKLDADQPSKEPEIQSRSTETSAPVNPSLRTAPIRSKEKRDFQSLYKKYPLKVGKTKGLKICERDIKTDAAYALLAQAIDRYNAWLKEASPQVFRPEPKHFSTFMAAWRDWLEPDSGKSNAPVVKITNSFSPAPPPPLLTVPSAESTRAYLEEREAEFISGTPVDPDKVRELVRRVTENFG